MSLICKHLSYWSIRKIAYIQFTSNRMDSGKFESVSRVRCFVALPLPHASISVFIKPYAFHQVMRSLFVPLRLATDARGLQFETDLDPNIDRVCLFLFDHIRP